jgi:methionyl-tRNA formyltransferase
MKYIFFGTPRFASIVLDTLIEGGAIPAAIVCNPNRPVGRKKILTAPETKQLIQAKDIKTDILQPERIDEVFIDSLTAYKADLFIVAAYGKILPGSVLDIPASGTAGVHPSLLPRLRGSSPIQSAILEDAETGVSLYKMDEKMDHGPIIAQETLSEEVSAHTYESLEAKLARLGGDMVLRHLPPYMEGNIALREQDHSKATFTQKFETKDGYVPYEDVQAAQHGNAQKAVEIDRKIRALHVEPGVYTIVNNKRIKLLESKVVDASLKLITIQREGKTPVTDPRYFLL